MLRIAITSLVFGLAACAGSGNDPAGAAEAEVRVAKCPLTITLDVAQPTLHFDSIRDEPSFSDVERRHLLEGMEAAAKRGAYRLAARLDRTSPGRCFYVGTATEGCAVEIAFGTKAGKHELTVDGPDLRAYIAVDQYGPESLTLSRPKHPLYGLRMDGERMDWVAVGEIEVVAR